ncbi:MAG TPA: hypothetical protein VHY20_05875, partial [Pirellulales bacterium]|nr:hypothetical protein [Pirellulales bacterium]
MATVRPRRSSTSSNGNGTRSAGETGSGLNHASEKKSRAARSPATGDAATSPEPLAGKLDQKQLLEAL